MPQSSYNHTKKEYMIFGQSPIHTHKGPKIMKERMVVQVQAVRRGADIAPYDMAINISYSTNSSRWRGRPRRRGRRQPSRIPRQCRRSLMPLFNQRGCPPTPASMTTSESRKRRRTSTTLHAPASDSKGSTLRAHSRGRNIAPNSRRGTSTRRRGRSRRIRYARLERWQLSIRSHLRVLPRMRDGFRPLDHHIHPCLVFPHEWEAARVAREEVRDTDVTELEDEHDEAFESCDVYSQNVSG